MNKLILVFLAVCVIAALATPQRRPGRDRNRDDDDDDRDRPRIRDRVRDKVRDRVRDRNRGPGGRGRGRGRGHRCLMPLIRNCDLTQFCEDGNGGYKPPLIIEKSKISTENCPNVDDNLGDLDIEEDDDREKCSDCPYCDSTVSLKNLNYSISELFRLTPSIKADFLALFYCF